MTLTSASTAVGRSETADGTWHAFLYERGRMINLGTLPGGRVSVATGINPAGEVVGWSETAHGAEHAFLYRNGTMIDLGTLPGGIVSFATGINSQLRHRGPRCARRRSGSFASWTRLGSR